MKYNITFGIALVCVSLFTACDNFLEPAETQTPVENGYGRISIILSERETEWSARTVFPSAAFSKYTYTFAKDGAAGTEIAPDKDGFFILEVGSYTVAVQAYVGNAGAYTPAASGVSEQFNVGSGNNVPIKVPLSVVPGEGKGKFNYTITYPAGAQAEITLQEWPNMNDIVLTPDNVINRNGKTQTLELDSGSYLLTVIVSKYGLYGGLVEAIHIYSAITTEYSKGFTDNEMFPIIPPTVNDYDINATDTFTYDGSEKTASITRKESASTGAVTILYNGTETVPVNAGTYTVTFNVAAAGDYGAAVGLPAGVITINKAAGAAIDAPTLNGTATYNTITINAVTAPATSQSVEYGINTTNTAPSTGWQADTTFSGLNSLTTYYIFARSASNDNYNTGIESNSLTVITAIPPAITLTQDTWADGNIDTSGGEQWFKFTATAAIQFIHFNPGTLYSVDVQLYDNTGATVGNSTHLYSSTSSTSRTITVGSEYYIRAYNSSYSGIYKIGFNTNPTFAVITTLTQDTWADGNIATSDGEQWFKFTATVDTQYIHFNPGTLKDVVDVVDVQLYDNTGATVEEDALLSNSTSYTSRMVTVGNKYYIRVKGLGRGTYQIAFNTSSTAPAITLPSTNVTTLIADVWADGNIAASNGEQWFKFTATVDTQYIHFEGNNLTAVYVQLYDNTGATVGERAYLGSFTSQTVTPDNEYYIKVIPYNGYGRSTYRIGFTTSTASPSMTILPTTNITTLTENIWANGSIALGGEHWFKFTATAAIQYIQFYPGTMSGVYIQLYDNTGATIGENKSSLSRSVSRTVTVDNEYYIRVTTSYGSGTYKIGFNKIPINVTFTTFTTLTQNTWAEGNITTSNYEHWFKFTATAAIQFIHFNPGTMTMSRVSIYDNTGATLGEITLSGSTLYTSLMVTVDNEYYIKVAFYNNGGTYKIGLNTNPTFAAITTLTQNTWANGNIATSGDEQWFKFTATAATQYIHFGRGTLRDVYVQLYDNTGATVGSRANLGSTLFTSRTLTVDNEYYIKVTPYSSSDSGIYRIGFNTSPRFTIIGILGIEMEQIPGGSFQMGNPDTSVGDNDERPVHTVTLSGFYMGKYEVTQEQWRLVMGSSPSNFTDSSASGEVQNKRPVDSVSWYDVLVFCNKLSIREGLSPAYSIYGSTDPEDWGGVPYAMTTYRGAWDAAEIVAGSTGYRLPTEAQWEYAARGGDGSPGNYTYSGSNSVDNVAWYDGNSDGMTHEVGKKAPNDLGLYDMSGNVFEWCWEGYDDYTSEAQTNPMGTANSFRRVLRGGSWDKNASNARSTYREFYFPYFGMSWENNNYIRIGFRVVRP